MNRDSYIFRMTLIYGVFVVLFGLLVLHFYTLQITRHEEMLAKAKAVYTRDLTRTGSRGRIHDVNGHLLVSNMACNDIFAEPRRMPAARRDAIRDELARTLDVRAETLARRFESTAVEIVVKRSVHLDLADYIRGLEIPGLRFVNTERRYHPKGKTLCTVLGFTNNRGHGVYGIEQILDAELFPKSGSERVERNRKGQIIGNPQRRLENRSLDGKNVYLTIDEPIQHIVQRELAVLNEKFKPRSAYAIMADPRTGAILAMAQEPAYDPNDRSALDPAVYRNQMVSDIYDPGSTMKCIAIAGALDYGVVRPDTVIFCENGYWIYKGRALHDAHPYGRLTVTQIIQKSSNIGAAKISVAVGKRRMYQVFRRFGFGTPTAIELPEESAGILRKPAAWDGLSITRFPIGQGISVTVLQMLQAYCAIANEGRMMKLHLIDRIEDPVSGKSIRVEPQIKHFVVRPSAARAVVSMMSLVTRSGGTARRAAVPGYDVAGKTGTSQKLIDGSYSGHGKYVASFIGFVPAHDPAMVLIVVADEPSQNGHYGGTVCAPTFQRIAEQTLKYLNILPAVAAVQ